LWAPSRDANILSQGMCIGRGNGADDGTICVSHRTIGA
jgi:hypothetical protein